MYIGGASLFECLRVNVVFLDAAEGKIAANSEPETQVCIIPFLWKLMSVKTVLLLSFILKDPVDKVATEIFIPSNQHISSHSGAWKIPHVLYFWKAEGARISNKTFSPPAQKVLRTQKSNSGQNFGSFRKIYMAHSKSSYNNKTDQQIG